MTARPTKVSLALSVAGATLTVMLRGISRFLVAIVAMCVLFGANTHTVSAQTRTGQTYRVKRGDTLSAIALKYGVTVENIMRANGIKRARDLFAGQQLTIPAGAVAAPIEAPDAAVRRPAEVPLRGKAIYVSIGKQRMYVYNNGRLVHNFVVSTGLPGRNTAPGNFRVRSKYPEAWSSIWQLRMPFWMGIYYVGSVENGIHALPINKKGQKLWAGLLGKQASFGCVILGDKNAATLYQYAPVGTPVIIRG
jgi:LysM repeat protein